MTAWLPSRRSFGLQVQVQSEIRATAEFRAKSGREAWQYGTLRLEYGVGRWPWTDVHIRLPSTKGSMPAIKFKYSYPSTLPSGASYLLGTRYAPSKTRAITSPGRRRPIPACPLLPPDLELTRTNSASLPRRRPSPYRHRLLPYPCYRTRRSRDRRRPTAKAECSDSARPTRREKLAPAPESQHHSLVMAAAAARRG